MKQKCFLFMWSSPCEYLEWFTHTQGSAAQSYTIQHSTVPYQYSHAACGKMALDCATHWPQKEGEERKSAMREEGNNPTANLCKPKKNVFMKLTCLIPLLNIFSILADLCIFFLYRSLKCRSIQKVIINSEPCTVFNTYREDQGIYLLWIMFH